MKFKKAEKHLKDVNMKKLFRRNQIIITTLAIMIAAAGYLNYAGKQELEAGAEGGILPAGVLEISDEDILAENQAAGYQFSGEIEEAQPQNEENSIQTGAELSASSDVENPPALADGGEQAKQLEPAGTQLAEIDSWDEGNRNGESRRGSFDQRSDGIGLHSGRAAEQRADSGKK